MAFLVRQERQKLEDRLSAIESKQRQLEAQDKLISEALSSASRTSVADPVAERLQAANMGHMSDDLLYHESGTRLRYPIVSERHGDTQVSSSTVTDVTSSKPVSLLPSASYSRVNAEAPAVLDRVELSANSEMDTRTARVREYHSELLQRQTNRQNALLEARRRLQMRAEQLLDSGLNFLSDSPSNKHRSINHSQSLTVLSDKSHMYDVENCGFANLSGNDVSCVENSDLLQAQVDVTKPYKPELYETKSLCKDVEGREYDATVVSPADDDRDDERQFVTPELREDGRVRPCRIAEYSPSPSPHANDAADHTQHPSVSPDHSKVLSNKDDFHSLILQAQRDLATRQRQMQDQLEVLETEEQRLAEQQLRISSQLGRFPLTTGTFLVTSHSEQQTAVLDPCMSLSSDLLAPGADRLYPSLSAQNTPNLCRDDTRHELSVSKDVLDISGSRSDQKGRMAVDNTSPVTEPRQMHMSRSAPQLQSCDHSTIPLTADQLSHAAQSPVSTVFGFLLKRCCVTYIVSCLLFCILSNVLSVFNLLFENDNRI